MPQLGKKILNSVPKYVSQLALLYWKEYQKAGKKKISGDR